MSTSVEERSKMGAIRQFSFVPTPPAPSVVGQRFGMLTVIGEAPKQGRSLMVQCRCDCGNVKVMRRARLLERKDGLLACGCLRGRKTVHGDSNSKLYRVWDSMVRRCHNSNHKAFPRYGGRGISVCAEWRKYAAFKAWAESSGYAEGLSIDRINNDAGYCPENCRWATAKQQQNNRECCAYIKHDGERLTVTQWSERLQIPVHQVRKYFGDQQRQPS